MNMRLWNKGMNTHFWNKDILKPSVFQNLGGAIMKFLIGTALAAIAFATTANAAITVSLAPAGANLGAFNNNALASTSGTTVFDGLNVSWSITNPALNAGVVNTSSPFVYLQPLGDTSNYIYGTQVAGVASNTILSWTAPVTSITFLW